VKWDSKDAQVMTLIIGSVDPNIVLNLRSFNIVAKIIQYNHGYQTHFWSKLGRLESKVNSTKLVNLQPSKQM